MSVWGYILLIACGAAGVGWLVLDAMSLWHPAQFERVKRRFGWLRIPRIRTPEWIRRNPRPRQIDIINPASKEQMHISNPSQKRFTALVGFAVGAVFGALAMSLFGNSQRFSLSVGNIKAIIKMNTHTGQAWLWDPQLNAWTVIADEKGEKPLPEFR